jgi:hypothetical protein
VSTSARFLLGGFYLANLLAFFIGSLFSHGHEFLSRGNQFSLLLVLSAAVSVLAVTFTRPRMLALAAAAINAFLCDLCASGGDSGFLQQLSSSRRLPSDEVTMRSARVGDRAGA